MQPPGISNFYPLANIISTISNANPVVVTTLNAHGYQSGNIIRIVTTYNGTMPEIDGKYGLATVLSPTTFSLPIDSTNFGAFTYYTQWVKVAQAIPISELNNTLTNSEQNIGPRNPLVPSQA